ncbi:MAG: mechanosensitive ion channel family protein [Terriglobales bacterium]
MLIATWTGDAKELFARLPWLLPIIYLGAGILAGIIVEKVLFGFLLRLVKKTPWEADDLIMRGFRWMPFLWCFLAGAYFANQTAELPARWSVLVEHTLLVLFLGSLTLVAARITGSMVALYSLKSEGLIQSTSILRNLTVLFVVICGVLMILATLQINITPILTALGVGGLAVALALQDTLGNLFAGIQILASRQVRIGDYIKLSSGEEGYVSDIRWRNTVLKALSNNAIVIPNSKLASTITTNFYAPSKEISVLVEVGVSYSSDLEKVERVTIEVAKSVMMSVTGGVPEHEPFIRFHTFGESSINFSVILRGKEFTDQYLVKHEFVKQLTRRYRQEGIEIPFPIRTVLMAQAGTAGSHA